MDLIGVILVRNFQYDAVVVALHRKETIRVMPKKGPRKGQVADAVVCLKGGIGVVFADGGELVFTYDALDVVAADGQPIIEAVRDLTGREISVSSIICYSALDSERHCVEVGRVLRISEKGGITVERLVQNGTKIEYPYLYPEYARTTRTVTDGKRTLLLPCAGEDVALWFLMDFDRDALRSA